MPARYSSQPLVAEAAAVASVFDVVVVVVGFAVDLVFVADEYDDDDVVVVVVVVVVVEGSSDPRAGMDTRSVV